LNDNAMFIDPRVGAMSSFLSKQFTTEFGVRLQKNLSALLHTLPKGENLFHLARHHPGEREEDPAPDPGSRSY